MTFKFFMLQVRPGSDSTLFFAETADECRELARVHQQEIQDEFAVEGATALPIYECVVREPDRSMMLDLLNSLEGAGRSVSQMCLLERHLIAPAVDQT